MDLTIIFLTWNELKHVHIMVFEFERPIFGLKQTNIQHS